MDKLNEYAVSSPLAYMRFLRQTNQLLRLTRNQNMILLNIVNSISYEKSSKTLSQTH
jgi:hypothetical protein